MNGAEHEVQAHVEARLFGVRLLSLRARVLMGAPTFGVGGSVVGGSGLDISNLKDVSAMSSHAGQGELEQAIALLHQSSSELHELTHEQPRGARVNRVTRTRSIERGRRQ